VKKVFLILLIIITKNLLYAQNVSFNWAKQIGGLDWEASYSMSVDPSGNVYTSGQFNGSADFDPGINTFFLNSNGFSDVFISKLDANGNHVWTKQIGGAENDYCYSIANDASGNVYTTGFFSGIVDFDPGAGVFNLSSANVQGVFILKLDRNGNFIWVKQMGGNNVAEPGGASTIIDASGNVYTTSRFSGTAEFDPGPGVFNLSSVGEHDIFVSKLDAAGNFVWAKRIGGIGVDLSYSIAVDVTGNIYTTGFFSGTADFDPGAGVFNLNSFGNADIFICKLNGAGNFIWAKQMGGSDGDVAYSITADPSGNVYTTGAFVGPADFDTGSGVFILSSGTSQVAFVSKLDATGNFVWAKQLGEGSLVAGGGDIVLDLFQNVYTTGGFYTTGGIYTTADFDPGTCVFNLTSAGEFDIYVSKLDIDGNFIWAKKMGGDGYDYSVSIALDVFGNVYTTGIFYGIADFDPGDNIYNLHAFVGSDAFVHKMSPFTVSACNNYVWNGQIFTASGVYTDTLIAANGCDSIVTLQLTMQPGLYSSIDRSICPGQNYEGYSSSGTYVDTLVTANGCDSIRTLQLTVLSQPVPDLGADKNLCVGDSLVLNPGPFNSYLWQDGSRQNVLTVKQPGFYSVSVTNNCGVGSDEVLINEGICDVRFPSAFTPNDDGRNDLFKVLGASNLTEYHLSVYNRWGQKVFETNDYTKGWAGKLKGQLQNTGVFVWYCELKKAGSANKISMKGTVLLIR